MKNCPFCKKEIHNHLAKCPHCYIDLVEKISEDKYKKATTNENVFESSKRMRAAEHSSDQGHCSRCWVKAKQIKEQIAKAIRFIKKVVLNKYLWRIIAILIFVLWFTSDDSTSNTYGTKIPLPLPTYIEPIQPISIHGYIPLSERQTQTTTTDKYGGYIPLSERQTQPTSTSVYQQSLQDRQAGLTEPYSLSNGTILKKITTYLNGDGQLLIKNGTNHDAIAKLISNGRSIFTVYIRAGSNYTITDVSDGTYWLAFMQGTDWDITSKTFVKNNSYQSFDNTFDFTTTQDDQYSNYSKFTITLNPVIGGTAKTSYVDPTQFNAY